MVVGGVATDRFVFTLDCLDGDVGVDVLRVGWRSGLVVGVRVGEAVG